MGSQHKTATFPGEDRQYRSNVKIIYTSTIRKLLSLSVFGIDLCIKGSNKFTRQQFC